MKSGSNMEGLLILGILIVIVFLAPKGGPDIKINPSSNSSGNTAVSGTSLVTPDSPYTRSVSLGTGNASRSYQSYEEYITIDNRGREPINITGWSLKNGKDKRAYNLGGDLQYFPADTAIIGRAALFISPDGQNSFRDIVLQRGERAIITTGSIGSQSPYKIVSFKENICSGYLEKLSDYNFTPPLGRNCPRPADEPGLASLDTECRKFVERMPSCHTPEFDTRDSNGEICYGCVDGKLLSSACVAFIKSHFSYRSCIANHRNNTNFSGKTWRVFLGRGWEMWATEYETIELFDQFGRLVNSRAY